MNKINKLFKNLAFRYAAPQISNLHKYKDIHRGESCYLMGDGVSLKWFELSQFSKLITIPCGFIGFHRDFKKLNARYMLLIEPWWFYPFKRSGMRIIKNKIQKIYRSEIIAKNKFSKFFVHSSNWPILRDGNMVFIFDRFPCGKNLPDFMTQSETPFRGSLAASISLAIYMGFDRCYLVGMDYTHSPSRSRHWYEKGPGVYKLHKYYQREFLECANKYIKIVTITLDGRSEYLTSETYKQHTGIDPCYKENHEIMDGSYLAAFTSDWGYNII